MKYIQALFFSIFVLSINLISCAGTPPKEEYVLSLTALENARKAESNKLAPKLLYRADLFYEKALNLYEERNYSKAKEYFDKSRYYSENAELKARIIKYKKGEFL